VGEGRAAMEERRAEEHIPRPRPGGWGEGMRGSPPDAMEREEGERG